MRRTPPPDDSFQEESSAKSVEDALFRGAIRLRQPARGYRFNVDSLLLAAFAARLRPRARRLVDLGAGVGGLALAYAHFAQAGRLDLVERDPVLSALALSNLARAGAAGEVHTVDLERAGLPRALTGKADIVLCNPPFFPAGSRVPHDARKRGARAGPLAPFLRAAGTALARRSAAFFVYPAPALAEFFAEARSAGLVAKRLRAVHAFPDSAARLWLLELRRAKPGGLAVEPPLVEWVARGVRTPEIDAIVEGKLPG